MFKKENEKHVWKKTEQAAPETLHPPTCIKKIIIRIAWGQHFRSVLFLPHVRIAFSTNRAHETKSTYLQAWLLKAVRTDNMIKSFKDVNLRHKNRTRITGQEWHVHRRILRYLFWQAHSSSKYGQIGGVHLNLNQSTWSSSGNAHSSISQRDVFKIIISRRFSSG